MRVHSDRRRTAYCDVFHGTPGDVNVFLLQPSQPSGWHRHDRQTDQFFVIYGVVKVGTWTEHEAPTYTVLRQGETITIEPGTWHGYSALGGRGGAELLMYLSQHYDPSDEHTVSFEEVPWAPHI